MLWLLQTLTPDFKTIAGFRKINAAAGPTVLRQYHPLGRELDWFGGQWLASDGTKVKAVNAADRDEAPRPAAKLRDKIAHLRARQEEDKGRWRFNYDHPSACATCPLKSRCTGFCPETFL